MAASKFDNNTNILTNIAEVYGLVQLITEYTRITDKSSTLIDLIFTNTPDRVVCSGVSHIGISDHSLVYAFRKVSIESTTNKHTTLRYRNFKNFNSDPNLILILIYSDPNLMWAAWKQLFLECVNKHAPLHIKRARASKSPWITPYLKKRMHDRDILKLKASRSKDANDWLQFKKCRNLVNNEIKKAKELYYRRALDENEGNSRQTWTIVNELTSRKTNNCCIKEIKSNSIYGPPELADVFNDHFCSIGPKLASLIYSNNGPSHLHYLEGTDKCFELKCTNPSKVFSLLSKLCKSKASGLGMISARLFRECADLIADPFCFIFNQSIRSGIFPQEWKCAKVIPLFKEGNHSDLNNYRPISIVPIVAKVFERIIYDQVYGYLTKNNLISSQQSGFRSVHSTVTALLEATNNWAFNIDKGSSFSRSKKKSFRYR